MAGENNISATLYVANAVPATNDAAGFEALTWTKVDVLIEEPQFGSSGEGIDTPNLSTGYTAAVKGARSGMSSPIIVRYDANATQTGYDLLKTIAKSSAGLCSVKIGYGTGTVDPLTGPALTSGDEVIYAHGVALDYQRNKGTTTSYKGYQVTFRQNAPEVEDTEPAA
ncbi:hypothetical protein [Mameliella alba]|uniref:hypothetical protein n=1 Tax=Mameliella alba TaxID=561184 RepID=UPI000B52D06A|nr:hypothetical protein [Mameliella alba]OWV44206.1 hypothetical protein CDZ95_05840 [Mameliella alba]